MALLIWQEENSGRNFRIQTDDVEIHRKMVESKDFKLVGEGMNVPLWIYRAEFPSLESARQMINVIIKSGE